MAIREKQVTAGELLTMPDVGFRYELVRGELRKILPEGSEHGAVAKNIGTSLNNHVKANGLVRVYTAETGFKLAPIPTLCVLSTPPS